LCVLRINNFAISWCLFFNKNIVKSVCDLAIFLQKYIFFYRSVMGALKYVQ
jgi:hypothetical protein